jgi:hypothetical protein
MNKLGHDLKIKSALWNRAGKIMKGWYEGGPVGEICWRTHGKIMHGNRFPFYLDSM